MFKRLNISILKCFLLSVAFSIEPLSIIGQKWESINANITQTSLNYDPVQAFFVHKGKLYIGGKFFLDNIKNSNNIICWDGKKADTVAYGMEPIVDMIGEYNNQLCIGGGFYKKLPNSIRAANIVFWKDSIGKWTALGNGIKGCTVCIDPIKVTSICNFEGTLYVGGAFSSAGNTFANSIAKWDGVNWDKIGEPIENTNWWKNGAGIIGIVEAMAVFHGKLYIGGEFNNVDGMPITCVTSWNNNKFKEVGRGLNKGNGFSKDGFIHDYGVKSLIVFNGELYAAGNFDSAGGKLCNSIAKWNDTTWAPLGTGIHGIVYTMTVYKDNLYVGGSFDSAGGKPTFNVASWNGKSWSEVAKGLKQNSNNIFKGRVRTLIVYKNQLYAGGWFNFSGDVKVNNIACLKDKIQ